MTRLIWHHLGSICNSFELIPGDFGWFWDGLERIGPNLKCRVRNQGRGQDDGVDSTGFGDDLQWFQTNFGWFWVDLGWFGMNLHMSKYG